MPLSQSEKVWMSEAEARATFGTRVFESYSARRQAFYNGSSDAMGWPLEKVVLLDQSGFVGMYQGKLHSFSGCSSLSCWGEPTKLTLQDVDLTNYQIVTDLNELEVWLKIPLKADWRRIDLKAMFAG